MTQKLLRVKCNFVMRIEAGIIKVEIVIHIRVAVKIEITTVYALCAPNTTPTTTTSHRRFAEIVRAKKIKKSFYFLDLLLASCL